MKVEVWSDVMCPFCYIGKRNYEQALAQFDHKDKVEIVWKSFQLDPQIGFDGAITDVYQYLEEKKGISRDQLKKMHEQVTLMARNAGLEYHLDKTVMANSFRAHRVIQLAKEKGVGDKAEEQFFYANFTEGKNFDDEAVLLQLGKNIGLTEKDVMDALNLDKYATKVKGDIYEAKELGINGVPFFVFDRKFAVSGAQPPAMFLKALKQAYTELSIIN